MKSLTALLTILAIALGGATTLMAADLPQPLQGLLSPDQALTDEGLRQMSGKAAPTPLPTPSGDVGLHNATVITGDINFFRNSPNGSTGFKQCSGGSPGESVSAE